MNLTMVYKTLLDRISDGGEDLEEVVLATVKRYLVSNPLHPDVFPGDSPISLDKSSVKLRASSYTKDGSRNCSHVFGIVRSPPIFAVDI